MMTTTIGIFGAGAIGTALGSVLESAGAKVEYWDVDTGNSTVTGPAELVAASQILILATPSWAVRTIASTMQAGSDKLVMTLAKGAEDGFVTMDQVLRESSRGTYGYGLLYGPMLAAELAAGKTTAALLAVSEEKWKGCLDGIPALKLRYTTDTKSVAICGVLKNIYALGLGIHDGLDLGANAKGVLAVRICAEMKRILEQLEADPEAATGLCGLGDLLATGWSQSSFNYRIGKAIAQKITTENMKGEGVRALAEITRVVKLDNLPVLSALHNIVTGGNDPRQLEAVIGA
jgi:glycerol-3-phosphate dehydrogenase (NAD(P)+)